VGVGGAIHVGGQIYGATTLNIAGTAQVNALVGNIFGRFGQNVTVNSTNASTATTNGALVVGGGVGIAGNVYASGNVVAASFQPTSASVPGAGLYLATTNILALSTASTERMRVDANGNVGIGTAGPTATLHLASATGNFNGIRFSATGWPYFGRLGINGTSGSEQYWSTNYNINASTIDNSTYGTSYVNISANGIVTLGTGATNTAPTERMRITSTGAVGIGSTVPATNLDVYYAGGQSRFGGASGNNTLQVYSSGGTMGLWAGGTSYLYSNGAIQFKVGATTSTSFPSGGVDAVIIDASGNVGIGTVTPGYKLQVVGAFAATTKSFVIDHPTKTGMLLRYGSLEGPENGVYVRGRLTNTNTIELPDYWTGLVDENSITVNLTAIGTKQNLWVEDIVDNTVKVGGANVNCFYTVFATRKDVGNLVVEF
jgi:hypothetical protein